MTEGQEKSTPQPERYSIDIMLQEVTTSVQSLTSELASIRNVLARANPSSAQIAADRIKVLISMWSDKRKGWLKRRNWDQKRTVDRVKHLEKSLKERWEEIIALRSVAGGEPQEPDSVKSGLKYIADSPSKEHGGFHPQTVEIAKQALARIEQLEAGGEPEQWISVEEKLPEFGGTYVVAVNGMGDDGEDYAATLPADWSVGDYRWYDLRGWGSNEVTHWMPLPAPPQGKEQK